MEKSKLVISNVMKELGVSASLSGYHYIRYGVELIIDDVSLIDSTMKLYDNIATKFDTTVARAERAIRHAITVGWSRGDVDLEKKMFGYSVDANKGKPTNSEFLATVADYILMTQDHLNKKGGK